MNHISKKNWQCAFCTAQYAYCTSIHLAPNISQQMKTAMLQLLEGIGILYLITLKIKHIKDRDTPLPPPIAAFIVVDLGNKLPPPPPQVHPNIVPLLIPGSLICSSFWHHHRRFTCLQGGQNERHQKRDKK